MKSNIKNLTLAQAYAYTVIVSRIGRLSFRFVFFFFVSKLTIRAQKFNFGGLYILLLHVTNVYTFSTENRHTYNSVVNNTIQ